MSDYYGKDRQEKEQETGNSGQEPWWNNVSQYMPKPVRPEPAPAPASQGGYDDEGGGLSPVVIVAIVLAVVAVIVVGGCAAAYAFSHQAQNQSTEITQADEDAAKKASDVYLTVYADGADAANCSPATVSVLKGTEGDEVVRSVNVKPGERADLGMLDAGQYRIHVDTVPTNPDGSTYLSPLFDIQFEVAGDGEDMELTCNLDPATSGDDASNQEQAGTEDSNQQAADAAAGANTEGGGNAVSASQSQGASGGSGWNASQSQGHQHNWVAQTKTVHHDAVYRTVNHPAKKERRTICNTCHQDVTDSFAAHRSASGHTGTHYEYKVTQDAYTERVLVSAAYDETVTTGYRCSVCGATR